MQAKEKIASILVLSSYNELFAIQSKQTTVGRCKKNGKTNMGKAKFNDRNELKEKMKKSNSNMSEFVSIKVN